MRDVVFLVLEVVLIGLIAAGVAVELGVGWGLVVAGGLGLGLVTVAQIPPGDG